MVSTIMFFVDEHPVERIRPFFWLCSLGHLGPILVTLGRLWGPKRDLGGFSDDFLMDFDAASQHRSNMLKNVAHAETLRLRSVFNDFHVRCFHILVLF